MLLDAEFVDPVPHVEAKRAKAKEMLVGVQLVINKAGLDCLWPLYESGVQELKAIYCDESDYDHFREDEINLARMVLRRSQALVPGERLGITREPSEPVKLGDILRGFGNNIKRVLS